MDVAVSNHRRTPAVSMRLSGDFQPGDKLRKARNQAVERPKALGFIATVFDYAVDIRIAIGEPLPPRPRIGGALMNLKAELRSAFIIYIGRLLL